MSFNWLFFVVVSHLRWINTILYTLSGAIFFAEKHKFGHFCRKNTKYGVFVAKSQHECSQDNIWRKLHIFLTNLTPGKYRENIAIYCIILKYREISFVSQKNSIAQGWQRRLCRERNLKFGLSSLLQR